MTKELSIVGASGHGKVVADIAEQLGFIIKFYDDAYPNKTTIAHWPILGSTSDLITSNHKNVELFNNVVVAIGNNDIRFQKIKQLQDKGFNLITLIHPSALVSRYAEIENGTVIFPRAVINAFARIGLGAIINTGSIVEHDCIVGDYAHISPNASLSGGVEVGSKCWIGVGSQVKQLVKIGNNTIIGAGSTVLSDIPSDVTAVGSPAKVI
jgi:sugar O-acyltransferase (sialic acid O-acetyltransferase NeuD family)